MSNEAPNQTAWRAGRVTWVKEQMSWNEKQADWHADMIVRHTEVVAVLKVELDQLKQSVRAIV